MNALSTPDSSERLVRGSKTSAQSQQRSHLSASWSMRTPRFLHDPEARTAPG